MKSGNCPKCGSDDLSEGRPLRHQGEGLMISSCNQCRFAELYTLDAQEKVAHRRTILLIYVGVFALIGIILAVTVFMPR